MAVTAMLVQIGLGFLTFVRGIEPENRFRLFYGFMVLSIPAFAYIFRDKISRRPALIRGVMLLFTLGPGMRAWGNVAG